MNEKIVRRYFQLFFSDQAHLDELREMLSDNFVFEGPLLKASSADEYIELLKTIGKTSLSAKIDSLIANEDKVVVLYDMNTRFGNARTVEWFTMEHGKIRAIELFNDPRPFLEFFDIQNH